MKTLVRCSLFLLGDINFIFWISVRMNLKFVDLIQAILP